MDGESAGGKAVGAALERLRANGYDVVHDVRWPGRRRAKIDHVAIGPAGVLVVAAENWSGVVSAHHGRLRQDGKLRDKQLDGVRRAGVDVAALLQLPEAQHVIPVLCLAGEHQVPPTRCGEVTVVDVNRVHDWASGLPQHLATDDVLNLAGELRNKLPPMSSPLPRKSAGRRNAPAATDGFRDGSHELRQSVRRTAVARQALVKLSLLLVLALLLPTVVHWWSTNGSDVMSSIFSEAPTPPDAAVVVPPTPIYDSCRDLRVAHPGGVASLEAHNTGRKLRPSPVAATSTSLYAANTRLDTDRDGLACEVVRKRKHATKP